MLERESCVTSISGRRLHSALSECRGRVCLVLESVLGRESPRAGGCTPRSLVPAVAVDVQGQSPPPGPRILRAQRPGTPMVLRGTLSRAPPDRVVVYTRKEFARGGLLRCLPEVGVLGPGVDSASVVSRMAAPQLWAEVPAAEGAKPALECRAGTQGSATAPAPHGRAPGSAACVGSCVT